MWDLISLTLTPVSLALEGGFFNHWTTWEVNLRVLNVLKGITFLQDQGWDVQRFLNLLDQILFYGRGVRQWCSSNPVWKVLSENMPVGPLFSLPSFTGGKEARWPLSFSFGLLPTWLSSPPSLLFLSVTCPASLLISSGLVTFLDCYWSTWLDTPSPPPPAQLSLLVSTSGACVSELKLCLISFFLAPLTSPVFCLSSLTNTRDHPSLEPP